VELHGCCARVSLAAALLSQHIDGVARAGSVGTKSGSSARSTWSCSPCWRPSPRTARLGDLDQLGLDDEASSEIADRYTVWAAELATVQRSAICQLPASALSSWSPIKRVLCADTGHRTYVPASPRLAPPRLEAELTFANRPRLLVGQALFILAMYAYRIGYCP
jgi:hypothetical protein